MNTKILTILIILSCFLVSCSETLQEDITPTEETNFVLSKDANDEELQAAGYEIFEVELSSNPKTYFLPQTKEGFYAKIEKLLKKDEAKLDMLEQVAVTIYRPIEKEGLLHLPRFSVTLINKVGIYKGLWQKYPILEIPEEEAKLTKYTNAYLSALETEGKKVYLRLLARPIDDYNWACRKILSVREGVR